MDKESIHSFSPVKFIYFFITFLMSKMSTLVFSYSFSFFHRDKLVSPMHIYVNYYIRRANKPSPLVPGELLSESLAVTILGNSLVLLPRTKEREIFFFFLAALGLCCCMRAFSSCREWGVTLRCGARASHCGGFSCFGAQALGTRASVAVACRL